jgi:hypothetical protein
LEPEYPLSYGNITVFSIFPLHAQRRRAMVIHGKGRVQKTTCRLKRSQRITIMAMKKKSKKKKAAKKS